MTDKLNTIVENFDDLVGYKSPEVHNDVPSTLSDFLGIEDDSIKATKIKQIHKKPVDPDFPEKWQCTIINVETQEAYVELMQKMNRYVNLKGVADEVVVYSKDDDNMGVERFF